MIKRIAKKIVNYLGYDIQRNRKFPYNRKDAFLAQKLLLSHTEVKTIFDLGACIGETVSRYLELFPYANIYCFEPFPEVYDKLLKRFENNSNIKPLQFAISNTQGNREFYINRSYPTNSFFPIADNYKRYVDRPSDMENVKKIIVPTTTIDNFCEANKIEKIEILKMDIQGAEILALEGATGKLKERKIDLIYTELLVGDYYSGQGFFYEICSTLYKFGYMLFDLYNEEYTNKGQLKFCDAIFISDRVNTIINT